MMMFKKDVRLIPTPPIRQILTNTHEQLPAKVEPKIQQINNFISVFAGAQCLFSKGSIRYEQPFSTPYLPTPL